MSESIADIKTTAVEAPGNAVVLGAEVFSLNVRKFSFPEILFGQGRLKYATLCARRLGRKKFFMVSDPGVEQAGWVERIFPILRAEGLPWTYFSDISSDPRDYQISEGVQRYREGAVMWSWPSGAESPMDAAKGIAMVASNGGTVQAYKKSAAAIHRWMAAPVVENQSI